MWIVRVALQRPYTFIVLALLILLASPVIIWRTPTDIFPSIDIPVIAVGWQFTGLNPEEVEGRITTVFERVLTTTVDDIEHIESTTVNGQAMVKIFLQPHARLDTANAQVTAVSQTILRQVPPGITPPLILNYRAALFPTISASASASSVRESVNRPFTTPNASTISGVGHGSSGDILLGLDMSYEVDFWGRIRRTVAAAREAQATAADLETARLGLEAELAMDYYELRAADAQRELLDETVKAFEAALRLTRNRFEGGAAPRSDVAQAQTQLETTRAQAIDVTVQRAQLEDAIATLIGKPPAEFSVPPRSLSALPPDVPVGLPSHLLERRPDIAAAERRVAEANEQIGIAKAAYFPTVTLNASVGFEGSSFGNIMNASSLLWSVGASITQTIFDGGRRRATSDAARAGYDATVAAYRQTTLTAFQQVEDNLAALRILEQEAQQQRRAVESAQDSLQLFTNRYRGGVDNYLQVITAQTITLTNQRAEIDILRRRMDASVLLVKALGGGWDAARLAKP